MTDRQPEAVWVTVTGSDGEVFTGCVLNQPTQLRTVQRNMQIRFVIPRGNEHPVLVTEKYLSERPKWTIHPCDTCGFSELFDAPSDVIRVAFHNLTPGMVVEAFTSFCPLCGGVQVIEFRESGAGEGGNRIGPLRTQKRAWWQIWKSDR